MPSRYASASSPAARRNLADWRQYPRAFTNSLLHRSLPTKHKSTNVQIYIPYIGRYSTEFTRFYNVFTFLVSVGSLQKPVLIQLLPNPITFYSHRDRCTTSSVRNLKCSSRRTIQLPECCIPPSDHSMGRSLNAKRKVQCSHTLYDGN
jgi:hypothetical protein